MNLDEIETGALKASQGPWARHHISETCVTGAQGFVIASCGGYSTNQRDPEDLRQELVANAAHIINCSPPNILKLLGAARALKVAQQILNANNLVLPDVEDAMADISPQPTSTTLIQGNTD